ncbi:MAG: L-threonylcarbamoyladenylate synthase [Salinivirgaceae bacterium]|jgi:tRNA threonylcarbamoyl adenosine modification protein (Sua5/YciO/YrdC/YwlC family)|nr:L-threonylcarbamoyladenylate synthase [Salinivirgaceae bacterium]
MADYIKLYEEATDMNLVRNAAEFLEDGAIAILPTDSVYSLACDILNDRALEKMARLKGLKLREAEFSIVCDNLSLLSDYCKPLNNTVFKLLKRNLPGPFTFILEANSNIPKIFKKNRKTVGIRVPANSITRSVVAALGRPIIVTSIKDEDEIVEYMTDPELIAEKYDALVDVVVDGGFGHNEPSTVVDCTNGNIEIIRQGIGELLM